MAGSPTSISLTQPPKYPAAGSMKITDQVIEEVDEQMTITSMRAPEQRPTAQSLFMPPTGPPPPSNPVMVPTTTAARSPIGYTRTQSAIANAGEPFTYPIVGDNDTGFISTSAPPGTHVQTPIGVYDINIDDFDDNGQGSATSASVPIEGSVTTENDRAIDQEDEFEKLRLAREKERIEKQKMKIVRSISNQPNMENAELLLEQFGSRTDALGHSNRSLAFDSSNL